MCKILAHSSSYWSDIFSGCGVQQFFIQGSMRSLGILFLELLAKYDASPTITALSMALVAAGFSVFGTYFFQLKALCLCINCFIYICIYRYS